jgi:hypothetical protein
MIEGAMKMEMVSSGVRKTNDSGSTTPYSKFTPHVDGSALNQTQPQQTFVAQ